MKNSVSFLIVLLALLTSCSSDNSPSNEPEIVIENPPDSTPTYESIKIPQTSQRSGDADKGYQYLISGDYMSSGIPYNIFILGNGTDNSNVLNRTAENATIPYDFNAIDASNGVKIVAPNCMQCHATQINNELIIGLGNQTLDFTVNRADQINTLNTAITILYGKNSKEWEAYAPFKNSLETVGPKTITKTRGVNPADKTTLVLTAYRDKNTLLQLDNPAISVSDEVIPSDVPAWWLLKKKNALFYHGIGREDFCRSMITMVLATLSDFEKAEEVDGKMKDILAYIKTIEAPKYPFSINSTLANQGEIIFKTNCTICHGSYGATDSYPNLLVSLKTVGTDPELSNFYTNSSTEMEYFKDWFNNGWFGSGTNAMKFVAEGGYVAPPLDGIWATAPYFHNASVPTIEEVLNSTKRPKYWTRTFVSTDYNETKVGWNYTVQSSKIDKNTYDTTQKGYGNSGHTFGDNLTVDERTALLEYLKTL